MNLPLLSEIHANTAFDLLHRYQFRKIKSFEIAKHNKWHFTLFPQVLIFDKHHRLRYLGQLNLDDNILINNTLSLIEKLRHE